MKHLVNSSAEEVILYLSTCRDPTGLYDPLCYRVGKVLLEWTAQDHSKGKLQDAILKFMEKPPSDEALTEELVRLLGYIILNKVKKQ